MMRRSWPRMALFLLRAGLALSVVALFWSEFYGGTAYATEQSSPLNSSPATGETTTLVRLGKERLTLDEIIAKYSQNNKWEQYRALQAKVNDNDREHLKLADWCKQHGLPDQEQAHLLRALDFEPDSLSLRRRLGHIRGEREWLSKEQAVEKERRDNQQAFATGYWTPRIQELQRLTETSSSSRQKAVDQLRAIDDPLAIPALENVLAKDPANAPLLVEILAKIDAPPAINALVRLAVDSEQENVRTAACTELKKLDYYSYVPLLLSGLRGRITLGSELNFKGQHYVEYAQHVRRAAQDCDELFDVLIKIKRHDNFGDAYQSENVRRRAAVEDKTMVEAVQQENEKTEKRNARIVAALEFTTGHKTPSLPSASTFDNSSLASQIGDIASFESRSRVKTMNAPRTVSNPVPEHWWQWWNDENEISEQRTRGQVRFYRTSSVVLSDLMPPPLPKPEAEDDENAESPPIPKTFQTSSDFRSPRIQGRFDCFVAGTPVWTIQGPRSIETIRTGDLLLTKNMATGELEFKAVIRPAIRPQTQLVRLFIGNESFTCTGGHLFCTLQNGWMKARDLEPGMRVQCAAGEAEVVSKYEGSRQQTFNLVVADNHNYFVGNNRLLTHDNSPRNAAVELMPPTSKRK